MPEPLHSAAGNAATHQAFSLYAANGRIYASNIDQKLIDLGSLTQEPDGFAWRLDGNQLSGRGLPDAVAALRDVVRQMSYLYLDGQFTALADVREDDNLHLLNAPQLNIVVDELQPGERVEDARA
ncbi:MAG TPA: hypothetical protein VEA35_01980 [Ramlibacter sp.]|nr:hypothetical protein [Ramlibacter sp.]